MILFNGKIVLQRKVSQSGWCSIEVRNVKKKEKSHTQKKEKYNQMHLDQNEGKNQSSKMADFSLLQYKMRLQVPCDSGASPLQH